MILKLKIVRVDSDYCDYLRKFDSKVAYNKFEKEFSKSIGIKNPQAHRALADAITTAKVYLKLLEI